MLAGMRRDERQALATGARLRQECRQPGALLERGRMRGWIPRRPDIVTVPGLAKLNSSPNGHDSPAIGIMV